MHTPLNLSLNPVARNYNKMYKMLRKLHSKGHDAPVRITRFPNLLVSWGKAKKIMGKQAGSLILIITFTVNGLDPRATCGSVV